MNSEQAALTVLFDFKDPYSYLALEPTLGLIRDTGVTSRWYPFLGRTLRAPIAPQDDDRDAWHRWLRATYQERDLCRYAAARGIRASRFHDGGLYRQSDGEIAAMGFNWATGEGPLVVLGFLHAVFEAYWDGHLNLDSVPEIEAILAGAGAETEGFDIYCEGQGVEELIAGRQALVEQGGFGTPACLFNGEAYLGRQHLDFLRAQIQSSGESGDR